MGGGHVQRVQLQSNEDGRDGSLAKERERSRDEA